MIRLVRSLVLLPVLALAACGGKSAAPAAPAATPGPATPEPVAPEKPAAPAIGPDECCCPFASAEGVAWNVSPKAACEEAGTGCGDPANCE